MPTTRRIPLGWPWNRSASNASARRASGTSEPRATMVGRRGRLGDDQHRATSGSLRRKARAVVFLAPQRDEDRAGHGAARVVDDGGHRRRPDGVGQRGRADSNDRLHERREQLRDGHGWVAESTGGAGGSRSSHRRTDEPGSSGVPAIGSCAVTTPWPARRGIKPARASVRTAVRALESAKIGHHAVGGSAPRRPAARRSARTPRASPPIGVGLPRHQHGLCGLMLRGRPMC